MAENLKSVAVLFLEDTAGGKGHPSIIVKKEEEKRAKQTHREYLGLVLQTNKGALCPCVLLTPWPYKIHHLSFPCFIFQGERKKTKQTNI